MTKTATKVKRGRRRSDTDSIAGDDGSVTMPLVPGGLRRHVDAQTRSKDDANCLHRICTDIQLFAGQISSNAARRMKRRATRRPILDYADSALGICREHFFRHQTTSPRDKINMSAAEAIMSIENAEKSTVGWSTAPYTLAGWSLPDPLSLGLDLQRFGPCILVPMRTYT